MNGIRFAGMAFLLSLVFFLFSGMLQEEENPPAPGFNLKESDPKAIEIADAVMRALGGRKNWDNTRYITWNFFGLRRHVWDKWTGNIRVESGDLVILMNLNTKKGNAWKGGKPITHPDSLKKVLDQGYYFWVNDSYWMFMPYKLKDTGVTLKYLGEGTMKNGRPAHILQLTFNNVGVTPENKYHVYVDRETYLVGQWEYYRKASDKKPTIDAPWNNWQRYGNIMLATDRGARKHSDIGVFDELPESIFTRPDPVDYKALLNQQKASKE